MTITISSDRLRVVMYAPDDGLISNRFDRACHISEIILDDRHSFCVPEQILPERVTSGGQGLCCEFVWPQPALEAKAGEQYPKLGVGLLTQIEDGKPFGNFDEYVSELPQLLAQARSDRVTFTLDMPERNGLCARVYRKVVVRANDLMLHTTVENTGTKTLDLYEYNHNFVSIDRLPVGPGYRLYAPFDKALPDMVDKGLTLDSREPVTGLFSFDDSYLSWLRPMDGLTYFKRSEQTQILPMAGYHWRLSHDASPAWIREYVSFAPHAFALWGVEHCICPEVFIKVHIPPGDRQAWSRTWTFGCKDSDS